MGHQIAQHFKHHGKGIFLAQSDIKQTHHAFGQQYHQANGHGRDQRFGGLAQKDNVLLQTWFPSKGQLDTHCYDGLQCDCNCAVSAAICVAVNVTALERSGKAGQPGSGTVISSKLWSLE